MSNYPLPKDPFQAAYLQHLRDRNVKRASICNYCKKQSTGINSDGYAIIFVCDDHYIPDNPNVVHRVYPGGLPYPKHMLDPNIGGWLKSKDKLEDEDPEFDPAIRDEIWNRE